jgi:hypothetical protein
MRVFPLRDLQVVEFAKSESASGRRPSRAILCRGGRFAEHSSNGNFTPIDDDACSSSRTTTPCAPTSVTTWRLKTATSKSTIAAIGKG